MRCSRLSRAPDESGFGPLSSLLTVDSRRRSGETRLAMSTPRRSVLFMPASNARALEKGRTLPADGLVFDLEDAVSPDAKRDARGMAVGAARGRGYGRREVIVRVNGPETPWGLAELERRRGRRGRGAAAQGRGLRHRRRGAARARGSRAPRRRWPSGACSRRRAGSSRSERSRARARGSPPS